MSNWPTNDVVADIDLVVCYQSQLLIVWLLSLVCGLSCEQVSSTSSSSTSSISSISSNPYSPDTCNIIRYIYLALLFSRDISFHRIKIYSTVYFANSWQSWKEFQVKIWDFLGAAVWSNPLVTDCLPVVPHLQNVGVSF